MPYKPDMNNGFIPKIGQKVRVLGRCHPRIVNKVFLVTGSDDKFHELTDAQGNVTGGQHGGLDLVSDDISLDSFN